MRVTPLGTKPEPGEIAITCVSCLVNILFNPKRDQEVSTTNEMEHILECPTCGYELTVDGQTKTVIK